MTDEPSRPASALGWLPHLWRTVLFPGAADTRWNFSAVGSLQVRASALLPDGRPLRVDLDAVPFLNQRITYYAVRTIDQEGAEEVCVTGIKAFDPLLERVRAIASRGEPARPSP